MKEYDFDPRNLPQNVLEAIGLAVACAAQTEGVIESAIAGCLGVNVEYGLAITTHMAVPLKFSVLRSAAEIRIDDLDALDELDRLLGQAEIAFEKRNAFVHHSWCRDPNQRKVFTLKQTARVSVSMDLVPMSVDQIKSDALFIHKAGMDLMLFVINYRLLPALSGMRPRAHKTKAARKKRRDKQL